MKTLAALFALSAILVSTGLAQIQWTLHPSVKGPDGPTAVYVTSKLGDAELKYVPPIKWTLSGSQFIPPGKTEADAYIDAVSIQAPTPWTDERTKALCDSLLRTVPNGAKNATILSAGVLPVQIDGQSACEICLTYSYYGQVYEESVVYAEFKKIQLQFHLGCLKDDFQSLHGGFAGSLVTLDWL